MEDFSTNSASIFTKLELNEEFSQKGYLMMPFLEKEEVEQLRNLFFEMHPENPQKGFYSTTFSEDPSFKEKINKRVEALYKGKVEQVFTGVKKLGASYLLKQVGEKGKMPIHQDWTVCEEGEGHFTVSIWVPLLDVNAQNGAMKVLPGSHRFSNAIHGPSLPVVWNQVIEQLEEKMETLEMKAGEAFIFRHDLLHSSHLNQGDEPRLAVIYGLAPTGTPLVFYWNDDNAIEKLYLGDELFMHYYNIGQRPLFGVSQGYFKQDHSPVTPADCQAILQGAMRLNRPLKRVPPPFRQAAPGPVLSMLKDENRNRELANRGYVILPLLDAAQVGKLKSCYQQHHPQAPERFYASAHVKDLAFRQKMSAEIQRILAPAIQREMDQVTALGGSFIAKPKGKAGVLPAHADWNIVDESHSRSFNLWVPLVDTTAENGAVYILPESHSWFDSFRGPGLPNPFQPVLDRLWDFMIPLEMKAGEALLYDHRLVHASPQNQTDELRLACVFGLVPKGEPMRFYCQHGGVVQEYASNVDFFMNGEPEAGPGDLKFLKVPEYQYPQISETKLLDFIGKTQPEKLPVEAPVEIEKAGFLQTYSPGNVAREIAFRLKKVFGS